MGFFDWFKKKKVDYSQVTGRNDVCPCGSGKKFKKCCMDKVSQKHQPKTPNPTPGGY